MTDLPYTYTDRDGAELRIGRGYCTASDRTSHKTVSVNAPTGEDAVEMARAVLAAAGDTEHEVISAKEIGQIIEDSTAIGARSMRERAAEEADQPAEWSRLESAGDRIRALPLLPDNADTLPEADMVEPGDEVPALAELADRVAALEELAAAQADLLEKYGRDLEGATRPASAPEQHAARYRDRDGHVWEEPLPGHLFLSLRGLTARPYAVVADEFGPLTPVTTVEPSGPCEVCGRAPDEQETGPDGRCRHTPATRLGHPTTKTGDTK